MLRAVFFDLDGTLLDTMADIRFHVNEMLQAFGYPPVTEEQTRAYIGDGAEKLIRRALPEGAENFAECFAYFSERFTASGNSRTKLYPHEAETLAALKGMGLRLAVITNKPQNAAVSCVEKFFGGMFDFIGGDSGDFACKPDPTLTRYAALTLRVAPNECLFVGDGETDVCTARNAGMRGVAALWGYRTREQLERAGAKEFAEDYEMLLKIAQKA